MDERGQRSWRRRKCVSVAVVVLDVGLSRSAAGNVEAASIQIQILADSVQHETPVAVRQLRDVHRRRPLDEERHQLVLEALQLSGGEAVATQERAQIAVDAQEALVCRLRKISTRNR